MKPTAPKGKLPCGHPAYVYDMERGCMAVLHLTPEGYVLCGTDFDCVMQWGSRYPARYIVVGGDM
ncbi:hypothetical protein PBI_MARYV_128 [Mycobacterium phage MaryV]|nr:hypothetical protein PBI_MARYV_128 [Mycobacterium phage MaryV]